MEPLHGILAHVAVSAVKLDGVEGHPCESLGAIKFDHRRVEGEPLTRLGPPDDVVHHGLRAVNLSSHLGEHVLHLLKIRYRLSELHPFPGVSHAFVNGAAADSDAHGRAERPLLIEGREGIQESLSLLAEKAVPGDPAVFEEDFGCRGCAHPHFFQGWSRLDPGSALFNDESADTARAPGFVGHRDYDCDIRAGRIRDERLRPVQYPGIAVLNGRRSYRCRIRSGIGLGEAEAADPLAPAECGQVPPLLLLRAVAVDRMSAEGVVGSPGESGAGAAVR